MFVRNFTIILIILLLSFSCTKEKKEDRAKKSQEKEYEISTGMEKQMFDVETNYDSLLTVVDQLTEMISEYPSDIELRKKLVSTCYDTSIDMIIASGRGRPLRNAQTPTIAMNYAEKVAKIEAYRWAANIKSWKNNPEASNLGGLSVEVPPARVVSQNVLPDSTVQVLVVINAEKIN